MLWQFELEDAGRSSPRPVTTAAEATVTLPFRRPPTGSNANTTATSPKDENRTGMFIQSTFLDDLNLQQFSSSKKVLSDSMSLSI